jgi:Holliday junction resolvase RusA-like endonuclease
MIVLNFPFKLISKDNERIFNKAGRYFLSKKFRDFERRVKFHTKEQYQGRILKGDVGISIIACFKNKVHSDATNLFKGICDALQGEVYVNDRQIKQATIQIRYTNEDSFTVAINQASKTSKGAKSKTP